MSAEVFGGLPDVADTGLHTAHVRSLEVAAYGVAPTAVLGFLRDIATQNVAAHRQVLFVFLPEVAALVVPLLFSYLAFLLSSKKPALKAGDLRRRRPSIFSDQHPYNDVVVVVEVVLSPSLLRLNHGQSS